MQYAVSSRKPRATKRAFAYGFPSRSCLIVNSQRLSTNFIFFVRRMGANTPFFIMADNSVATACLHLSACGLPAMSANDFGTHSSSSGLDLCESVANNENAAYGWSTLGGTGTLVSGSGGLCVKVLGVSVGTGSSFSGFSSMVRRFLFSSNHTSHVGVIFLVSGSITW